MGSTRENLEGSTAYKEKKAITKPTEEEKWITTVKDWKRRYFDNVEGEKKIETTATFQAKKWNNKTWGFGEKHRNFFFWWGGEGEVTTERKSIVKEKHETKGRQ